MRKFFLGIVVGAAITALLFFVFGNRIRGGVVHTAQTVGHGVQRAGQAIEKTGRNVQ